MVSVQNHKGDGTIQEEPTFPRSADPKKSPVSHKKAAWARVGPLEATVKTKQRAARADSGRAERRKQSAMKTPNIGPFQPLLCWLGYHYPGRQRAPSGGYSRAKCRGCGRRLRRVAGGPWCAERDKSRKG